VIARPRNGAVKPAPSRPTAREHAEVKGARRPARPPPMAVNGPPGASRAPGGARGHSCAPAQGAPTRSDPLPGALGAVVGDLALWSEQVV
jgi:hypothetical protein